MPEKLAAMGIQMHSGWGVLVAISASDSVKILDRRRIVVIDPTIPGAKQPYHYARQQLQELSLDAIEKYLANSASLSEQLATAAVEKVVDDLYDQGYRIAGAAILQSAARELPSLSRILASHPLIHTAEGEFFCRVAKNACEQLKIPVINTRRRDLDQQVKASFGRSAQRVQRNIAALGKSIGPPWTVDHKTAALAAATILSHA
jgi:hypothetical protein